jgi:hypothetical protein
MARRRVPTPRCRKEGTPAKQGLDASDKWFPPFAVTKGVDRQGETGNQQRSECCWRHTINNASTNPRGIAGKF